MTDSGDSNSYNAVPPPASLASTNPTVDFNDALSKVRAVAARMQKQNKTAAAPVSAPPPTSQGTKRSFEFNDDPPRASSESEDRDRDRDAYARSRSSAGDTASHDDYGDRGEYGRESKRSAYDAGSSRPSYSASGESRRFGLGSEERKTQSAYGPGSVVATPSVVQEFTVPNSLVGLVIGKMGENLKRIERTSGAKVQFSQDQLPSDPDRRVTVTGRLEDVKSAREMIQQALDDARAADLARRGSGSSLTSGAAVTGRATLTITIPSAKVGLVIGRGGETIRDLQDRSGAKIMVTPDNAAEKSAERTVNLLGEDDAIQRAKALIDEIVNADAGIDKVTPSRDWSAYRQTAQSDDGSQGSGGGGRGEHSRASSFSESRGRDERERIHNPMENRIDRLERMEREQRQDRQQDYHGERGGGGYGPPRRSEESETIQVPNDSVGFIIGKGGETVRMLQDQSGAKIKVEQARGGPPSADRNVFLYGTAETIDRAKQLILEKIASGNQRERGHGGGYGGRGGGEHGRGGDYGYGSGGYGSGGYGSGGYGQQPPQQQGAYGQYGQQQQPQADYSQYYAQYGYAQGGYGQAAPPVPGQQPPGAPGTTVAPAGYNYGQAPATSPQYPGYPYTYGQYAAPGTASPPPPGSTTAPPGTPGATAPGVSPITTDPNTQAPGAAPAGSAPASSAPGTAAQPAYDYAAYAQYYAQNPQDPYAMYYYQQQQYYGQYGQQYGQYPAAAATGTDPAAVAPAPGTEAASSVPPAGPPALAPALGNGESDGGAGVESEAAK